MIKVILVDDEDIERDAMAEIIPMGEAGYGAGRYGVERNRRA